MAEESPPDPSADRLAPLYGMQRDRRRRWLATGVAAGVGLALASVHWVGLVAGGALVGFAWPTVRRALVAGLGFGCLVVAVFAGRLALAGTLDEYLATGPLLAIAVVTPLVAGPLGATARALVPDAPRYPRSSTETP